MYSVALPHGDFVCLQNFQLIDEVSDSWDVWVQSFESTAGYASMPLGYGIRNRSQHFREPTENGPHIVAATERLMGAPYELLIWRRMVSCLHGGRTTQHCVRVALVGFPSLPKKNRPVAQDPLPPRVHVTRPPLNASQIAMASSGLQLLWIHGDTVASCSRRY